MVDNNSSSDDDSKHDGDGAHSLRREETSSTLLPHPVASLISLATFTSSLSLRIGSAIGTAVIDGARIGTLTSFELGRAVLEVILARAGQDVADSSTGRLGRAAAENLLDRALNALHNLITTTSFLVSAGFNVGSFSLNSSVALSQHVLSAINATLGDTETSKAIATIIALIRRESRISEDCVNGSQVGVGDLLVGTVVFALLQRWCAKETEQEFLDNAVLQPVWDLVVLNNDRRDGSRLLVTPKSNLDTADEPNSPSSERSMSMVSTPGENDSHAMLWMTDRDSSSLSRPNSSGHGHATVQSSLRDHISSQLKPGSTVRITTEAITTNTIKIEISGDSSSQLDPPPGFSLLSVEQPNNMNPNQRILAFQNRQKDRRWGSFEIRDSEPELALAIRESDRVIDMTDATEQLQSQDIATSSDTKAETSRILANEKRPRRIPPDVPEQGSSYALDNRRSESNDLPSLAKKQVHSDSRLSLRHAIKQNSSVKNLVDFWSRTRPRGAERSSPSTVSKPDAGRESLASSRRGSDQTSLNNLSMWPISGSRMHRYHEPSHSHKRGLSPDLLSIEHGSKHKRGSSSVFTIATDASETAVVVHTSQGGDENEYILNSLHREGYLPGTFPRQPLARNLARFVKFSVASYGSSFIRFMGGMPHDSQPEHVFSNEENLAQHHSFSAYSGLPPNTVLLSSFVDSEGGTNALGETETGMPLVHYVSIDHESKAIVLTCRGTLGFEDVLTDMSCDYDDIIWGSKTYKVHKGMHASALRMLTVHNGRIMMTVKTALEKYEDYGFILCGHSLGGGVASLLAILLSEPSTKSAGGSSNFVTASSPNELRNDQYGRNQDIVLPPNRPIHVYTYGPPAVFSPTLQKVTRGLITTVINNQDIVPHLSLGTLHDFRTIASTFKTDNNDAKSEVRQRVWENMTNALREKAGFGGTTHGVFNNWLYINEERNEDHWPQVALKSVRAGMLASKLMPPGEVFVIQSCPVLQRHAFVTAAVAAPTTSQADGTSTSSEINTPSYCAATNIKFTHVRDVESRFRELRLVSTSLFADHIPARYEQALATLERGLCL